MENHDPVPTDEELIRRCCARPVDHNAWSLFYNRHYRAVRNRVHPFTAGSPQDVDDLAQEAFAKIFRVLPKFDSSKSSLPTFLSRVAVSAVIDYLRHGGALRRVCVSLDAETAALQLQAEANPEVIHIIANQVVARAGSVRRVKIAESLILGRDVKEIQVMYEASAHEVYTTRKWLRALIEEIGAGWQ
jgi:RNA polymerase sigma factor (sigma-70 family)